MAAGVLIHLLIDGTMLVGFFSYEVFIAYLAFVPEDRVDIWLSRLRDRFRREIAVAHDEPQLDPAALAHQ